MCQTYYLIMCCEFFYDAQTARHMGARTLDKINKSQY